MGVWNSRDQDATHELELFAHDSADGLHFCFATRDEFAGPNSHGRLGFQLAHGRHIESSSYAGAAAFDEPRFAIDAHAALIDFGIQARVADDLAPVPRAQIAEL